MPPAEVHVTSGDATGATPPYVHPMTTRNEGLSKADFDRLRTLIYDESGISLSSDKKTMLEIRIKRRLRSLDISSFGEYCDHVFTPQGREAELVHLIDVTTTNKTDFFREAGHFDYLVSQALPDLAARLGAARKSLIWSAGCSTGEEPYTLAMVLSEYAQARPGFRFGVLATDICTAVLAKAAMGIFKSELVRPVPQALRRKYFMRSRDPRIGPASGGSRTARPGRVSTPQLHGRRLRPVRTAGNHLLPERDHLF